MDDDGEYRCRESDGEDKEFMIDCQVKCNTIREKIFEAPRRESGN